MSSGTLPDPTRPDDEGAEVDPDADAGVEQRRLRWGRDDDDSRDDAEGDDVVDLTDGAVSRWGRDADAEPAVEAPHRWGRRGRRRDR